MLIAAVRTGLLPTLRAFFYDYHELSEALGTKPALWGHTRKKDSNVSEMGEAFPEDYRLGVDVGGTVSTLKVPPCVNRGFAVGEFRDYFARTAQTPLASSCCVLSPPLLDVQVQIVSY